MTYKKILKVIFHLFYRYYLILRNFLNNIISVPLVDYIPQDISEFLNISEAEFRISLKNLDYIEEIKKLKDYDNWLENSHYYFYDLCQWHLKEKIIFFFYDLFQPKNLQILDFGSGIGTRAIILSRKNNVTIVEKNKDLILFSKLRFKKYDRCAEFYRDIPKNKKYDLIILYDVIGHLVNPVSIISNLCSILKKNGKLKITFDNFDETESLNLHRNKEIDFHKLLIKNGLKKVNSFYYNYVKL